MAFVIVNPRYRDVLAQSGLASAADFLACAGEPVCVRAERRVERVALAENLIGYLKKETRVLVRERLSSWWGGFGWSSKSVREGMVLGELARAGIGCPAVIALGEEDGQAFVLLKEERDLEPLDRFLRRRPTQTRRLAKLLGSELARMHEAGFYHPDLFAKHVLVGQADGLDRVCLIDWQRTRQLDNVSWSRRIVDLAALDASLAENAVAARDRLRLLASYLHRASGPQPCLKRIIAAIRSRVWLLLMQRRIHRQHVASVAAVPLAACPPVRTDRSRRAGLTGGQAASGTTDNLGVGEALAGPHNWYGWQNCPLRLTDPSLAVLPLVDYLHGPADLEPCRRRAVLRQAGRALRDLHEAGYAPSDSSLESWAVSADGSGDVEIVLTSIADLAPTSAPLEHDAADLARLLARHGSSLGRTELMRVVRGYVGANAPRRARRDLVRRILDAREPAR